MDKLFSDLDGLMAMSKEKADKNLRECKMYLENDFQGIARLLEAYHPLEILRRAEWYSYDSRKKKKDDFSLAFYSLLPMLLQSILISTHYKKENFNRNRMVKSKDFERVLALSMDVHRKLLRYIDCYTVYQLKSGTIDIGDAERYRTNLFKLFYPPRETEERTENIYYVFDSFASNESERIEKCFGISGSEFASSLKAMSDGFISSIDKLSGDIKAFKAEVELLMAQKRADSRYEAVPDAELQKLIIHENGWDARSSTLASYRDDFDLFRPDFYADLKYEAYLPVAAEPGEVDLYSYLDRGLWPASMKPFIKFGSFIFTFLGSHMISYGNRMLMEAIGASDVPSRTAQYACSQLFNPTDSVDVYSFDGNKIDLIVLPSMIEVNPYTDPARFSIRLASKEEEKRRKSQLGHNLLIVDPDNLLPMEKTGDKSFLTSASFLLKSIRTKAGIKDVHQTIFGTIDYPDGEKAFDDSLIDSELDNESYEDELLDDYTSDEYEYQEDEEVLEEKLREKEAMLDQPPEDYSGKAHNENIERLRDIYELTPEIVRKEEEEEKEEEPLENELDETEYIDDSDDDFVDDDVPPEDESLYDEAEAQDTYIDDSSDSSAADDDNDPAQLDFFSILDEDDTQDEKELTEELEEEDEKSFEAEESKEEALDKEYSDYVDSDDSSDLMKEDGVQEEPAVEEPARVSIDSNLKESEPITDHNGLIRAGEGLYVMTGPRDTEDLVVPDNEADNSFLCMLTGCVLDIIEKLGSTDGKFAEFIKASDHDMIEYLNSIITSSWKKQQIDHKDKLFSIYDYSISVLLAENPVRDDLRLSELLNNAGAVMYSRGADEWTALILYIDGDFTIQSAIEKTFSKESFSASDWKRIVNIGEILIARSKK